MKYLVKIIFFKRKQFFLRSQQVWTVMNFKTDEKRFFARMLKINHTFYFKNLTMWCDIQSCFFGFQQFSICCDFQIQRYFDIHEILIFLQLNGHFVSQPLQLFFEQRKIFGMSHAFVLKIKNKLHFVFH